MFNQFRGKHSLSGWTFLYMRFRLQECERVIIILWGDARLMDWVFLVSSPISRVNQVYLRWILSSVPLCELCCTRYVQFECIVISLMNGTVEILS